jgi:hypothetical protein
MNANGTLSGNDRWWFDVEGIGNIKDNVRYLGDLADNSYVLVAKNYATTPGGPKPGGAGGNTGIEIKPTHVSFDSFGANDQIYFDSQFNNQNSQKFVSRFADISTPETSKGHTTLQQVFSFTAFDNDIPQSWIALNLEGQVNNNNTGPGRFIKMDYLYGSDATSFNPEFDAALNLTLGQNSQPVIMA